MKKLALVSIILLFVVSASAAAVELWSVDFENGFTASSGTPIIAKGDLNNPEAFDVSSDLPELEFRGETAEELAEFVFDISSASYQGDDIRVCSICGIRSDDNCTWNLAIRNRHQ